MTSRTRYNASQVLQLLYNNPNRAYTQRELHGEVAILATGSRPLSDAMKSLVASGHVKRTPREGREATYQLA